MTRMRTALVALVAAGALLVGPAAVAAPAHAPTVGPVLTKSWWGTPTTITTAYQTSAGNYKIYSVKVNPTAAGREIRVIRYINGGWRTYTTLTATGSSYGGSVSVPSGYSYRVVVDDFVYYSNAQSVYYYKKADTPLR